MKTKDERTFKRLRRTYGDAMDRELAALRGLLAGLAEDMTWSDLAAKSTLCPATLKNFFNGATREPRFRTIFSLAKSLGVEVGHDYTMSIRK